MAEHSHVDPEAVHVSLARHLLVDGMPFVLDLRRSSGCRLVDQRSGTTYLDLYTFFASSPLGVNPPQLIDDPTFLAELATVAVNKPANPDVYTCAYAEFVDTFVRVLGDPALPHLFFVEGGALAVENALKVAFDWKSRRNEAAGRDPRLGSRIMHFTHAFHGRSGYTLSLTNTEPVKTARFPAFDWPRIDVPAITFPIDDHRAALEAAEDRALEQAARAFAAHPHDIAAFITEPIQGEGGDHHLRGEFLQRLQRLVHDHDALFVVDEVQTGAGTTGSAWAYQQLGLEPDVVAFSKKVQLGGIMAGRRVDEIADHVFAVPGRINSTWGGGLTDMVRSRRILEVIEAEGLIENARVRGAYFLTALEQLARQHPELTNCRGRGLFLAADLPSRARRDTVLADLRDREHVIALPCGERSVRFRPALTISEAEITEAVTKLGRCLARTTQEDAA